MNKHTKKLQQEQIEGSLLERQALTGQDIDESEAIMDALARSNKLYAIGIDNYRLHWLLEGIASGRIDIATPLERAIDETRTQLEAARAKEATFQDSRAGIDELKRYALEDDE